MLDRLVEIIDKYLNNVKAQEQPQPEEPPRPFLAAPREVEPAYPEKPSGLSPVAEDLISDVITPFRATYQKGRLLVPAYCLVQMLDTQGLCPSVVGEPERIARLPSGGNLLAKVNLRDHSFRVARGMLELHRDLKDDWNTALPHLIVTALGHDIGKMPEWRDAHARRYATADHPVISAWALDRIFGELGVSVHEFIRSAILSHHRHEKETSFIDRCLKQADAMAREEELKLLTKSSYTEWDDWFTVDSFVKSIEPHVNVTAKGNYCPVFTWKSFLFATPDFLFAQAQVLAKSKGVCDPLLMSPTHKTAAIKRLVHVLGDRGAVADLPPGYFGLPYVIDTGRFSFRMFLTPLRVEVLPSLPSAYELRKVGWLLIIRAVRPYSKK
jgi:hypothetical protein